MTDKTHTKTITGSLAIDKAIAGFLAGAMSTTILHPLDLIKTRFQVDETRLMKKPDFRIGRGGGNTSTFSKLSQIYRLEGGIRGLYCGLSANLAGSCMSWGIYFWIYQTLKDNKLKTLQESHKGSIHSTKHASNHLSAFDHLLASAEAGALTSLMTNPLWVMKTRMCASKATDPEAYKSLWNGLFLTWKYEGIRGLYKGFVPALFGVSHGAIQFMVYEQLKIYLSHLHNQWPKKGKDPYLNILEYQTIAVISKVIATVCTYPYQVIRARIQNERTSTEYSSVSKTIQKIYRNEGLWAMYKGLGPNLIRVLPGTIITFTVYESLGKVFQHFGS